VVIEALGVGKRVLIVDDEPQIGDVLSAYLAREGFTVSTHTTAEGGLAAITATPPDVVLLDLTLPDGNGLDLLQDLRARNIPTLIVSARSDEVERVVGLELGADDYITKPFSPREVVARLRAVLRRVRSPSGDESPPHRRVRVGDLEIDKDSHEVFVAGKEIHLTPTEFRILALLAEHPGQVFTRSQMLDALHDDGNIYERTLDRHVNNLRRKIEPDHENPTYILTVYGVGYKIRKP
jgi:DNA-binding response OmpR family regulator